jgi:CcmD family protein
MTSAVSDTASRAIELATVPKFPFLVAAYVAFFAILFAYVLMLRARQRQVDERLKALEKRVG